jgi:hypothetical protein
MGAIQDMVRWCIAERAKLCGQLEDFETTERNVLDLNHGAAVDLTAAKLECVKRIANLDNILRKYKTRAVDSAKGATCSNR